MVRVSVQTNSCSSSEFDVMIDTGFTDFLALPMPKILGLELSFRELGVAQLADGTLTDVAIFEASVDWYGESLPILVCATDGSPLIGMSLLRGSKLELEVIPDGPITLTKIKG